jgi:hypothetical protein
VAYAPHFAYTFNGSLPGSERWAFTLRYSGGSTVPDTQPTLQACADAARARAQTFVSNAAARFSTAVTLDSVQCRRIGGSGGGTLALAEALLATPVAGVGSVTMPNHVALVATFHTGSFTRSGRGRIYLPCLAATVIGGGVWSSAQHPLILPPLKTLLNGIASDMDGIFNVTGLRPIVASKTTGQNNPITTLRVGNVLDTQRRRSLDVPESFVTDSL